jgi:prephenate dehydratase
MHRSHQPVLMAIPHKLGALEKALNILSKHNVSFAKVESRPSKEGTNLFDFIVDVEKDVPQWRINGAVEELKKHQAGRLVRTAIADNSRIVT